MTILISAICTLLYAAISFYITLPPINLRATEFYHYMLGIVIVFSVIYYICDLIRKSKNNPISIMGNNIKIKKYLPLILIGLLIMGISGVIFILIAAGIFFMIVKAKSANMQNININIKGKYKDVWKKFAPPIIICGVLLATLLIGGLVSLPIFNSGKYQKLLTVTEGSFAEDVAEINYSQIPTLDKDSAARLGNRKMGELSDLVSQFEVSDMYTQINYNSRPTRVTPLLYGDFFKWMNNNNEGIPAYMKLDMVSQEVECVRLEDGIKYSQSELFGRKIERHLRFQYPTFIFGDPVFEIDEEGNPYWVCSKIKKTVGLFGGEDVDGVVLCDAVTGESEYYPDGEIPQWVDRAYSADLLIEQYDYHGEYIHGFWNSIVGQKDVKETTDGYNYMALNDDVYVYTGITSVTGDESNIGFVLMNQRTKETKFYAITGAEEYSAMYSAEGEVQHLDYRATFPLLLNIAGEPTYFIPLKDYAGLVKKYSMVNVAQYQTVAVGDTIKICEEEYRKKIEKTAEESGDNQIEEEKTKITGTIKDIKSAVIDGNTTYYIVLDNSDKIFRISAYENQKAVMLSKESIIEIEYAVKNENSEIIPIIDFSEK